MTPVFAVYSLMVISIETEIPEMYLDIDRVFGLFFSLKYELYRLGLDGISVCVLFVHYELVPKCKL